MAVSPGQGRVLFEASGIALKLRKRINVIKLELNELKATLKLAEQELEVAYRKLDESTEGVIAGLEPLPLFPQ